MMPNGLQVILHQDHSYPVISYAIMHHVGSSRETPGRTGFAHLFEHLLFSGSGNALEKILWLESDRMGFPINPVTPPHR